MRKFTIDFTTESPLADGSILGKQGEHNATELVVIPPAEMTECEEITSYRLAFGLTNCRCVHSESIEKAAEISMLLFSQITLSDTVEIQLEGYSADGNLVMKSETVKKLKFLPSVCGKETGAETDSQSMAAEVTLNTLARHSHENKDILDLLSADGENLTYNGKSIGGGVTSGSKFYSNDWASGAIAIDSFTTPSLLFLINEEYPENRLITDVSIRWNNGEITDYSFFELIIKSFIAGASTLTVSKKPVYEETNAMYAVAQIANVGEIINSPLYAAVQTSDASIEGFTVHYIVI